MDSDVEMGTFEVNQTVEDLDPETIESFFIYLKNIKRYRSGVYYGILPRDMSYISDRFFTNEGCMTMKQLKEYLTDIGIKEELYEDIVQYMSKKYQNISINGRIIKNIGIFDPLVSSRLDPYIRINMWLIDS